MVRKNKSPEKIIFSGKRKTAIAKVRVKAGSGKVFYNHLSHEELGLFHRLALSEPLRIFKEELGEEFEYDFFIKTRGGGKEAQIQAARLAMARALVTLSGSEVLKKAYVKYDIGERKLVSREIVRRGRRDRSRLDSFIFCGSWRGLW